MGKVERKTEVSEPGSSRKAHCNRCLGETTHAVLYGQTATWREHVDFEDGDYDIIEGADTHALLQCGGCEEVRLLHEHWFSEDWEETGPIRHRDYYPPAVTRRKPDWVMMGLPIRLGLAEFGELIDEIYKALAVRARRLAAMGIRSLVEKMMIDKVHDQGTFVRNIEAFFEAGYVAKIQQDIFRHTLVEAGHAAMHREWNPTEEDLDTLLDIVEGLIKAVYIDPARAKKVGEKLPPRNHRPAKEAKSAGGAEAGPASSTDGPMG